ncbi:PEBP-like protein [Xylariaceae sp. FL1651]|nr:PEBP-like protein [Xylariaceae sp. FL1651]
MGKISPSLEKTLSAAKESTTLRIHYPEATVSEAGTNVTIEASKPPPTFSISTTALKSAAPGTKYVVVGIDLDAPFPSFSFMSPILHGVQIDLVAGDADGDGFAPLQGPAEWVVPYIGPGPPKPSAAHHYVFMVFEQPQGIDAAKVKVGMMARMRFDEEGYEKKIGLGEVIAGNYFLTRA